MFTIIRKIDKIDINFQVCKSGVICQTAILIKARPGLADDIFRETQFISDDQKVVFDCDLTYMAEIINERVFIGASAKGGNNIIFSLKGEILYRKTEGEGYFFYEIYGDQKGIDKIYLLRIIKEQDIRKFDVIDKDMNVILGLNHPIWWGAMAMYGEYFFSCLTQNSFTVYHFPTQTRLWDYDASQFGKYKIGTTEYVTKIQYFVGFYNETIYVLLTNETLIAVDIHTGKITHKWDEMCYCVLDKNKGRIIGFKLSYKNAVIYKRREVNLNTKELHIEDISSYFAGLDIKNMEINWETPIMGDHLICIFRTLKQPEDWDYGPKSGLLAYNLVTDKVDWQYFVDEGTFAGYPKVARDRIYVRNGSLFEIWIFEKSKT